MKEEILQKLKELKNKIEEMSPEELAELFEKTKVQDNEGEENPYGMLERILLSKDSHKLGGDNE